MFERTNTTVRSKSLHLLGSEKICHFFSCFPRIRISKMFRWHFLEQNILLLFKKNSGGFSSFTQVGYWNKSDFFFSESLKLHIRTKVGIYLLFSCLIKRWKYMEQKAWLWQFCFLLHKKAQAKFIFSATENSASHCFYYSWV